MLRGDLLFVLSVYESTIWVHSFHIHKLDFRKGAIETEFGIRVRHDEGNPLHVPEMWILCAH